MIPAQREAFQRVVDRFPNHTIELNDGYVAVDGKQIRINWPVDEETWNSSYCGIPASQELELMLYEYIYVRIHGKPTWSKE